MKKLIFLTLAILTCIGMIGCGNSVDASQAPAPSKAVVPQSPDSILTSAEPSATLSESTEPDYWSLVSFQSSTSAPKNSLVSNSFEIKDSLYGSNVMGALKTTKIYESYEAGENVKLEFICPTLKKRSIIKAFRRFNVQALCIFPCFCPYEPKQGKVFYAPPTTLSSNLAEVRFASLVA